MDNAELVGTHPPTYLMKLEGNISGGALDVDLPDGADLANLGLWQSE